MVIDRSNGIARLRFPNLMAFSELQHAVFSRRNGCSRGPYRSLNTSLSVGDDPTVVMRNRGLIRESLAAPELVFLRQVHGRRVVVVGQPPASRKDGAKPEPAEGDALVTDRPGRFLTIQVADCQPVLLYDPTKKALANVHSGWRGSLQNVLGAALAALAAHFGTCPRDVVAGVGPSLGPCCAEFVNYRREIPRPYWSYKNSADHFDFWALSRDQLLDAGVPAENLHVSGLCTRCNTDMFFSYRGEGVTGRFAVVAGLKADG
jgi:YfiH family protein